jgi:hypothetical protein
MRPRIAQAILDIAYSTPRITLADVANGLRQVIHDPIEAERKVGALYGSVFKKKEAEYDARGGRHLTRPEST